MADLLRTRQPDENEDFYKLLGCDETSTVEQIATEYKLLARKHHPDKVSNPEEKDKAEQHFIALKRAKEVLLDEEMRKKYDEWRNTGFGVCISFDDWLSIQSRVHTSMHWATSQKKTPSLPGPPLMSEGVGEDERLGTKRVKTEHSPEGGQSSKQPSASRSSALQEFRRGSEGSSLLSKFRNYEV